MLRVTDPQLENLMFLRDVTIPWMRENPGRVDLDQFNSECGTYGCLLGWYAMQRYKKTAESVESHRMPLSFWAPDEFGIERIDDTCSLFGSECWGTLDDRARYLDELIAQRLVALEAR